MLICYGRKSALTEIDARKKVILGDHEHERAVEEQERVQEEEEIRDKEQQEKCEQKEHTEAG
jgi:hypothetical protein